MEAMKANSLHDDVVTSNNIDPSMCPQGQECCSCNRGLQLSATSRFMIFCIETLTTEVLFLRAPKVHTARCLTQSKVTYMSSLLCEHLSPLVNNDRSATESEDLKCTNQPRCETPGFHLQHSAARTSKTPASTPLEARSIPAKFNAAHGNPADPFIPAAPM